MNPIISWLKYRIRKKKGNNIIVCGETGGGKSLRGLRLGELLDFNGFDKTKVSYSAEQFLEQVNTQIKKGDARVWDENLGADASDWYSRSNKAVKRSIQVMRKKQFSFIQCLPSIEDLDPKVRKYFQVYIEPKYFNEKQDGYWCLVMRMQHNPRNKKTYFKYFRFRNKKTKRIFVCKLIFFRKPQDAELLKAYEDTSEEAKDEVHKESLEIVKEEKELAKIDWRSPTDIAPHILTVKANLESCRGVLHRKEGDIIFLDVKKIANLCKVGLHTADRIKKAIE